jgi:hypothetical protein
MEPRIRGPPQSIRNSKGEHFRMLPALSCADVVELAYTAVFKTAAPRGDYGFEPHRPHSHPTTKQYLTNS